MTTYPFQFSHIQRGWHFQFPLKVTYSKTLWNIWTTEGLYLECPRNESFLTIPVISKMQTSITSKAKYHDRCCDRDEEAMDLLSGYNGLQKERRQWGEGINTMWIRFELRQDIVKFRVRGGGGDKNNMGWMETVLSRGEVWEWTLSRVCVTPPGSLICSAFVYFSRLKPLWRHIEVLSSSITWHRESCRQRQTDRQREPERRAWNCVRGRRREGRLLFTASFEPALQGNSLDSCLRYVGTQLHLQFQTSINLHSRWHHVYPFPVFIMASTRRTQG